VRKTLHVTLINSPLAPQPAGGYAQAVALADYQQLLFISGQIPVTVDGQIPADFAAQAHLAWHNVIAQLESAGMSITNLVKVTVFLAARDYTMENRRVRQAVLGDHKVAMTVIIADIFDERWLLEIEAVAAA
jgi:2-iminobutanoate/2-iminopropanoate deaminase